MVESRSTKIALPSIFSKLRRDRALEYSFLSVRDACALLSGSGIFSRDFGGDWERRVRDYKLRKISVDNRIRGVVISVIKIKI